MTSSQGGCLAPLRLRASGLHGVAPILLMAVSMALGLSTTPAWAAGFAVGEQGAASYALGGAVTARADVADSAWFNPAAWAAGARPMRMALGGALIAPSLSHQAPGASGARTQALLQTAYPPYAHMAFGQGAVAGLLSLQVPFGSHLRWPEDWSGRHDVTRIGLEVLELAPSLAWRPHPTLAFSAGGRAMQSKVEYARQIDVAREDTEARVRLTGEGRAWAWQASSWWQPRPAWSLGAAWRSAALVNVRGAASFEGVPVELGARLHDSVARTQVALPSRLALGAAWAPQREGRFGRPRLSVDVEFNGWSSIEAFSVDLDDPDVPDMREARHWENTWALRAGLEQQELYPGLNLRAGVHLDPTPSPPHTLSPSLPDANRLSLTAGAGYRLVRALALDVGYGRVFFAEAPAGETGPRGSYRAGAHVFTLGLSWSDLSEK